VPDQPVGMWKPKKKKFVPFSDTSKPEPKAQSKQSLVNKSITEEERKLVSNPKSS
jgi:hypothetical protein